MKSPATVQYIYVLPLTLQCQVCKETWEPKSHLNGRLRRNSKVCPTCPKPTKPNQSLSETIETPDHTQTDIAELIHEELHEPVVQDPEEKVTTG